MALSKINALYPVPGHVPEVGKAANLVPDANDIEQ